MRIVYNGLLPFRGFSALNLFGVVFARRGRRLSQRTLRHEAIHTAQGRELLWVPFYVAYLLEWLVRLLLPGSAYRNVSFEREAREHEWDPAYLDHRRHWAQWRSEPVENVKR